MKTKLISIAALMSMAFMVNADSDKKVLDSEDIEITIDSDGDEMIKKIIVNGKQLSPEEIKEFEASGKMKTLHMDHGKDGKVMKVIMIDEDSEHGGEMQKHVKIIKKHMGEADGKHMKWITKGDGDEENIEVTIETDGDETTEKVTINGKELSAEEIKEFKDSGKMKVIHLDGDMKGMDGHKMMFIKSGAEGGEVDVEVIMDQLGKLHESHDGKNVKIIEKKFIVNSDGGATLGIMANVEDDGWHLSKIIEESGAKDAGIKVGDIVTRIGGVDLTNSSNDKTIHMQELPKFDVGEMVVVILERDGESMELAVEARELNSKHMLVELIQSSQDSNNHIEWIEKLNDNDAFDLSEKVKVMVFDSKNGDFKLNEEDIHMVFPDSISDMNIFISDGSSTSKLLGKYHEMSALSEGMGKYFKTKGGVLILHVDETNAFALKDGDVIKSINGNVVNSPKDVVKQLIQSDDQEKIKLKVIRHKKSKTLKYRK